VFLDSGFRRNDRKGRFLISYKVINDGISLKAPSPVRIDSHGYQAEQDTCHGLCCCNPKESFAF